MCRCRTYCDSLVVFRTFLCGFYMKISRYIPVTCVYVLRVYDIYTYCGVYFCESFVLCITITYLGIHSFPNLRMYIYICVYVCIYICESVHIYVYIHIFVPLYVYMYTPACVYSFANDPVFFSFVNINTAVYWYICVFKHINILHICLYIHTHTCQTLY